jgi:hypothetical protein
MRTLLVTAVAVLLIGCLVCTVAGAQQQCPSPSNGRWQSVFVPYIWFSSIGGDAAVRGIPLHVSASFADLASDLDMGLMFHLEAQKNDWGFFVDPTYVKLGTGGTVQGVPASIDFKQWIVDFAATHEFPLAPRGCGKFPQRVWVLFGGRYWNLSNSLSAGELSASGGQSWVDPFVGARYATALSDKWSVQGRFDVGSDSTWNAALFFGYKTSENGSLMLGYRALSVDHENGSGDDFFKWDMTYYGPVLGYEFRF